MGFFSKLTCDTQESIANIYSGHPNAQRPVYLLQPDGEAPLKCDAYEGYGVTGRDWFEWLSERNVGIADRDIGIFLDCGNYYQDSVGRLYVCSLHLRAKQLQKLLNTDSVIIEFSHYGTPISALDGLSMNQAIEQRKVSMCDIEPRYPIKLSYNPNARYEDYPPSAHCDAQGYFY